MMQNTQQRITTLLFWPFFFTTHLLALGVLSWHLLAQVDFAYPLGYKLLNLETHIKETAPFNRFKPEFELTTPAEHWSLFSQITTSVQHHGKGLAEINYRLANGTNTPLMHQAEIIHLQDVANLIDVIYNIGTACALMFLCLLTIAYYKNYTFPAIKKILLGFIGGVIAITATVLALGPTRLFYWLHTKIFPDGHQWFFYYEDSLMTTLMKAPDIFAFIAFFLLSVLVTLWIGSVWGISKLLAQKSLLEITKTKQKKPRKR